MVVTYVQTRNEPVAPVQTVQRVEPPTVDELFRLVNEERAKVGVAPLVLDPLLNQSAQMKAQDMLDRNYFTHTDPTTGKNNGLDYALAIGKQCTWISENISWGENENTSQSAMIGWKNSKPHYTAMIDPRYESTGFGIAGNKIAEHFCDER